MNDSGENWLLGIAVAIGIAGVAAILWLNFRGTPETTVIVEPAPQPEPVTPEPRGPDYPVEPPGLEPGAGKPERTLEPLPPLDDSDAYFRLELIDLFGEDLAERLAEEAVIEKVVASTDNLPREQVAERLRPLSAPPGEFAVVTLPDDAGYRLAPANYARYEPYVDMLEAADVDDIVDTYRRFYPLLQEAYVRLGYPDGYFNDRAVAVIDHLLATPLVKGEIRLTRPNVLYEYADPELESLSSGQKFMIRAGPENAERIRAVLRRIRAKLVDPGRL